MFRLTESRPGVVADVVSAHHIWRRAVIVIGTTLALIAALVVGSPAAHAAPVSTAPATITSTVTTAPTLPLTRAIQQSAFDAEMIKLVNQARKQGGLPALKEAKGLTTLAVTWANTMLKENKLYHMPSGLTRAQKSGAANLTTWGENVGRGPIRMSAKQLFDAYWNSPGHRANIMSSKYSYIGMGTVQGASMAYNAMEFTDKVESTATTKKAAKKKSASKYGAKTKLTVTGGTNIRSGPATSYKSLAKVYKGHKLTGQLLKGTNWYYLGSGKYIIKSKVKTAK